MYSLLSTVGYIHKNYGYTHRDIKTENVVFRVGEPVLIDFGSISDENNQTMEFGTRAYQRKKLL